MISQAAARSSLSLGSARIWESRALSESSFSSARDPEMRPVSGAVPGAVASAAVVPAAGFWRVPLVTVASLRPWELRTSRVCPALGE